MTRKHNAYRLARSIKAVAVLGFVLYFGHSVNQKIERSGDRMNVALSADSAWSVDDFAAHGWYQPTYDGFCKAVMQELPDMGCRASGHTYEVRFEPIQGLLLSDRNGKWRTLAVPRDFWFWAWRGRDKGCFVGDDSGRCVKPYLHSPLVY